MPRMACQKSMFSPYSRSVPFCGVFCGEPSERREPLVEDVLEISRSASGTRGCAPPAGRAPARENTSEKSNPPKPMFGPLPPGAPAPPPRHAVFRIVADLIVHLLLLRIAQDVVGFLDLLETILGGFVAGIEIGMMLARKLTVRLADVVRSGVALHPECLIEVHSIGA